jgi:hypothetical protein
MARKEEKTYSSARLSIVAASSLKSVMVPTRSFGTPGIWCSISGYHYKHLKTITHKEPGNKHAL